MAVERNNPLVIYFEVEAAEFIDGMDVRDEVQREINDDS